MATLNLNEKKIPSAENLRLIAQLCISLANKQSSLEDRCIAPWKSGEVYQKDISYVSYNNYLYFCTVSNSDTDFVESHWTKLSDTISELTKTDIEALVNLTPEQITNLQSLIDDTSISTTHTNSSSHIYMAIQDAIAECKDDTLKQIAKKVSGSYKIANTTADIVSADYIYLLSNGSNYDLYVLVDGTATKVGDTNIDLSEYIKATDLADYMKTSDADGKFATITTVDGKIDKTNIIIGKDNSATDDQVYSAKAINTELDGVVKKTDIIDNLTSTDTDKPLSANQGKILDDKKLDKADVGKITVLNANGVDIKDFILKNCTEQFKEYHIISTPTCTDIPANNYFYMIVRRTGNNTFKVTAKEANCTNEYVRNYRSDAAVWTKWAKVCTTTVEDIPKTNIAPVNETTFVNFKGNSMCNYCVENGVCYVSLWGVQVTVTGRANTGVMLPLPKSGFFGGGELIGGGDAEIHAYAHTIPETGELKFNVKDANVALYGMFSYPVEG